MSGTVPKSTTCATYPPTILEPVWTVALTIAGHHWAAIETQRIVNKARTESNTKKAAACFGCCTTGCKLKSSTHGLWERSKNNGTPRAAVLTLRCHGETLADFLEQMNKLAVVKPDAVANMKPMMLIPEVVSVPANGPGLAMSTAPAKDMASATACAIHMTSPKKIRPKIAENTMLMLVSADRSPAAIPARIAKISNVTVAFPHTPLSKIHLH
mmetsp:Transcript_4077/g.6921  ORF Transcript_4077/g.6921 Transcript_4077/m.6921 type:complete len:213 (+) Transcript_4077:400-1038(+)